MVILIFSSCIPAPWTEINQEESGIRARNPVANYSTKQKILLLRVWYSHAESIILLQQRLQKTTNGTSQYLRLPSLINSTSTALPIGMPPKGPCFATLWPYCEWIVNTAELYCGCILIPLRPVGRLVGRRSTVNSWWSTVNGWRSMVDGRWLTVDHWWLRVDGQRSMVNRWWLTVDGW